MRVTSWHPDLHYLNDVERTTGVFNIDIAVSYRRDICRVTVPSNAQLLEMAIAPVSPARDGKNAA